MAGMNPRQVAQTGSTPSVGVNGKGWGLAGMGSRGGGGWTPTVTYLLLLVIAEFAAYALLRYTFRQVHAG